jgi:tRNA threonylcarbamoyladenosine biosynthesis protein TsaE
MVQGIALGWGSPDNVTSPTFILVNQYRRSDGNMMFHLDAYRLGSALEAEDLDLDLMLEEGCLVIEWPEKIEEVLPEHRLWIKLGWLSEERRHMTFDPTGKMYKDMVEDLRHQAFGG